MITGHTGFKGSWLAAWLVKTGAKVTGVALAPHTDPSHYNDLDLLELVGIGSCSGIPGDPHDNICMPSRLSKTEKESLLCLEYAIGRLIPDTGRYILAIGQKR